jgi:hypothetical protein
MNTMKKTTKILVAAALLGFAITSCKKEDTSAPSVSVNGAETVTLNLHEAYIEQGATASDSKDGDLEVSTSGAPDVNNAGVYMITYTASDKAGNTGDATRRVIVRHSGSTTAGTYAVKDSCGNSTTSYVDVLSNNSTIQLSVTRFANYDNANAFFEISGETNSTITVPQQTIVCGTIPVARVFKGSGSISPNGKKLTINYTEVTNSTTISCTGVYTKP